MVGMVRALIADPRAIAKSFSGRNGSVIPCIGGNECHYGRAVACASNPSAGREAEMEIVATPTPKRILVVGAGPAGLECAASAAERGHRVVLVDRRTEMGGMLISLAETAQQADYGKYLEYIRRRIKRSDIELRLGLEADLPMIENFGPDAVVLATGARYRDQLPTDIPGSVLDAAQVLEDSSQVGSRVVVAGGLDDHLPPLLLADFLARIGRRVTLLTENIAPGSALESASLVILIKRLLEAGVNIQPTTAAVRFSSGVLATRNSLTNTPGSIDEVDSVVVVAGRVPNDGLAPTLKELGLEVHVIGDALSPRRMLHATLDGARLGRSLF